MKKQTVKQENPKSTVKPKSLEGFVEFLEGISKVLSKDGAVDLMVNPKTKACYIPDEYLEDFFDQLIKTRGTELARVFIETNGTLAEAFPWIFSEKGHAFWSDVEGKTIANYDRLHSEDGEVEINIKKPVEENKTSTNSNGILVTLVKEAESRGFAIGVTTKFGLIRDRRTPDEEPLEHELCNNGDFFYYNIKVLKNGKWLKPNVSPKKGYKPQDIDNIGSYITDVTGDRGVAIHNFVEMLKGMPK